MFTRKLQRPETSILLLGPRGTGKSTWIRQNFPDATLYDLLDTREALRLSKDPGLLYQELIAQKNPGWAVIDEVQKVPALLDEVHRLIETKKFRFILSGSSARKLKRGVANLLAGRARSTPFFPLVSSEVKFKINIPEVFGIGTLPLSYTSADPHAYLTTYAQTYLQEEIKAEALTRNLGGFARFLEIAARHNGQVTNVAGLSRDAQVARQTVQGFFDILEDTLIAYWLPAWKLKRATKQVAHPKLYFFDPGVARALSGRVLYPPHPEELGPLVETFIINEIRAYLSYQKKNFPIYYWKTHDGVEVDFLCETKSKFIALEIKSSNRWENKYGRGLDRLEKEFGPKNIETFGVYLGKRELSFKKRRIVPILSFLKELWVDQIFN